MRSRRIRAQEDAEQFVECLRENNVSKFTLHEAKSLAKVQGRPISTETEAAVLVLINQGLVKQVTTRALIENVSDELLEFEFEK